MVLPEVAIVMHKVMFCFNGIAEVTRGVSELYPQNSKQGFEKLHVYMFITLFAL